MINKRYFQLSIFSFLFLIANITVHAQTNAVINVISSATVGTQQHVEYRISYYFDNSMDSTKGTIKLVKDARTNFVLSDQNYDSYIGDTLIWSFSKKSLPPIIHTLDVILEVKDPPIVQVGDQIKNIFTLRFNSSSLTAADTVTQSVVNNCVAPDMSNITLPITKGIQWMRLFGSQYYDEAIDGVVLSDTSFVVVGAAPFDGNPAGTPANQNGFVAKYHANGNLIWKKILGGALVDNVKSVVKAQDGGVIVAGTSNSTDGAFSVTHGRDEVMITKLDSNGNIVWQKLFGGSEWDQAVAIRQFRDNQYVVIAMTNSRNGDVINPYPTSTLSFSWLFGINESGNMVWQKVLSDTLYTRAYDMQVTPDKKFVIAGYKNGTFTPSKLLKTDSLGNELFLKSYVNPGHDYYIHSLVVESDSTIAFAGMIEAGSSSPSCLGTHGWWDGWVGKTDKDGNLLWQKMLGGTNQDQFNGIRKDNSGGYLVAGSSSSNNGNVSGLHTNNNTTDAWFVKLDNNGNLLWQKMVGGNYDDIANKTIQLPNQDIIVIGQANSYNNGDIFGSKGAEDALIFKIGATNNIRGAVYLDNNGNHIKDANEAYFPFGTVKSVKGDISSSSNILNGFYTNSVDTGTYITEPGINLPYYTAYPLRDTSTFTNYLQAKTIDFAMVPMQGVKDLRITILPINAARPGFQSIYKLKYENVGTTTLSNGSVKLVKDNRSTFDSASFTQSSAVADTITWNFTNLAPMQFKEFNVYLKLTTPPNLNNGDSIRHYATITPVENDSTPINNSAEVRQRVTGSFDPNDKTEAHGPGLAIQNLASGDYLNYVIRFQNTGTDTAFRVIVRDTLDNKLDWNTFQMINASHAYTLTITNKNMVEWKFDPILLPDSSHNLAGSNGYVAFRIKPMPDLELNDTIPNTAAIYFDFNLPVITNTQNTIIQLGGLTNPIIAGLLSNYCRKPGAVIVKIMNMPANGPGITTVVKIDNSTTLAVSSDSTFNFDASLLTAGPHTISVKYLVGTLTLTTEWPFNVIASEVLNLNLSANVTTVTNPTQPVIITGVNASGGANLLYSYARDRNFTNILQGQGSNNVVTIDPTTLNTGSNWIYGIINANGQCYTESSNMDSIEIVVNIVTGIVDVDAPGHLINVYPVPFSSELTIKGFSPSKKYEVELINAQGNRVLVGAISNRSSYKFNTMRLTPGLYVVHVSKNGKKLGAIRVVKQ